jgi:hypothetical protein
LYDLNSSLKQVIENAKKFSNLSRPVGISVVSMHSFWSAHSAGEMGIGLALPFTHNSTLNTPDFRNLLSCLHSSLAHHDPDPTELVRW